jgi:sulfur relay (sulfurtransferase) DsrC/TusE family protein
MRYGLNGLNLIKYKLLNLIETATVTNNNANKNQLGGNTASLKTINMRGTRIHYEATGNYDVIDFIQEFNINFNRGNAIKYLVRAGKKQDELQDLYKAKDYIEREIAYVKEIRDQKVKDFKEGN